jgi:replicative DNA helicase
MDFQDNNIRRTGLRKTKPVSLQQISELGKLPPQAVDLEEAVLGALMLEKDALTEVIDILRPQSFYKDSHQFIFEAIEELFKTQQPVDILTVTQQLKKSGKLDLVGGPYAITQLTSRVGSSANAEFHARIIAQKFIQRELIRISTETIKNAYEDSADVFDLLDKAEQGLFSVVDSNIRKQYDKMSTLIHEAIKQIETAAQQPEGLTGVPSGFTELDRVTNGWQRSSLIIIAARPAMGKTAFVLTLARNAAIDYKKPVAVFSLEMSSLQLVNRLISSETELNSQKLLKGDLQPHEFQQLNAKIGPLTEAPIYIDDTPALTVFELRAKARRLKEKQGIEILIVDYLQLMTTGGEHKGNREQEISTISRSLKAIAKELNIPVIALSQLSRAVETRGGDKKPQLSDLRESGAIEQDADQVMFIHRPEYYGIIIAKNRSGSVSNVNLRYISHLVKFTDMENNSFSGDYSYSQPNQGLSPSNDFTPGQPPNTIIMGSRMNDIEEEPF